MRRSAVIVAAALALAGPAGAGPLDGKRYMVELSSTQYDSGYGNYLLPPLQKELGRSRLKPAKGPGEDAMIFNIVTESDVGRWVGSGDGRQWIYTIAVTIGISPEAYVIPWEGTPAFGVRAQLETPNSDRQDEWDCLIGLAARTAIANYKPKGLLQTDGSSCARKSR